jgi:hypothetical protein
MPFRLSLTGVGKRKLSDPLFTVTSYILRNEITGKSIYFSDSIKQKLFVLVCLLKIVAKLSYQSAIEGFYAQ